MSMFTYVCQGCGCNVVHPVIVKGEKFCAVRCYRAYYRLNTFPPVERHRIHYGPGTDEHVDLEVRYEKG